MTVVPAAALKSRPEPVAELVEEGTSASVVSRARSAFAEIFGIDLRALAALRVGLGALILIDLFGRAGDLTGHYSDLGMMPRAVLLEYLLTAKWCICLHLISGAAGVQALLFLVAASFAVCLVVGWHTRLATACSWYLLLSLHDRNPLILQGGDTLLRMMLFWGIFLPLGAVASMDALRMRQVEKREGRVLLSIPGAALLLQVAFVYWFSALLKNTPVWTKDYTALYYALSLDPFVTHAGKLLLHYHALVRALSFSSLWWERVGPFLAFAPARQLRYVRMLIPAAFIGFHAGMALCLNLGLFPLICCVAWIVFLPPCFWDGISLPLGGSRYEVVSQHMPAQAIAAFFLTYVFLWNWRTVADAKVSRIFPHGVDWVAQLTRVDQIWDMFAPAPLAQSGWFVMPAQLEDGREVDLFHHGAPVDWRKPAHVADDFKNDRWRKYMVVVAEAKNTYLRAPYADYLAYAWNSRHPAAEKVRSLQIYLMMQEALPDYRKSAAKPILLWSYKAAS